MARALAKNQEVRELQSVKRTLESSFAQERWDDLVHALGEVSRLGEKHARIELSIQAQSLTRWIADRAEVAGGATYSEMETHFGELVDRLSHLAWTKEV